VIKILVVDDSPAVAVLLEYLIDGQPDMMVTGVARNGREALAMVERQKPDIVTMDIDMPVMDGFEATSRIMETCPIPIVIVTATRDPRDVSTIFRALESGALAVLGKPLGREHPDHEKSAAELIETLRLMSEVKVVKRRHRVSKETASQSSGLESTSAVSAGIQLVAIGASTGGPPVLRTILSGLSADFPVPILVVQHIAMGFSEGFADWLGRSTGFPVKMATDGEIMRPGVVYVAPDEHHMGVRIGGRILLNRDAPENGLRPSISHLFRSAAGVYASKTVAVLLTGMGKDGAEELRRLKELGAVTIAQDEETSVVNGMPGEAVKLGAARYVLPPEKISRLLEKLAAGK
jgi:two-component system chemotaxis response regulator CheB